MLCGLQLPRHGVEVPRHCFVGSLLNIGFVVTRFPLELSRMIQAQIGWTVESKHAR